MSDNLQNIDNEVFNSEKWLIKANTLGYQIYLTSSGVVFRPQELRAINSRKDGIILSEYNNNFDVIAEYLEVHEAQPQSKGA